MRHRKKLIEVALPLDAINKASVREGYIYRGNPSALHKWWAQRPLAAARAVIFAQMVDDPSANPDLFPTEKAQEKERKRLFRIIEDLVKWENTTNEAVLQKARDEIWQSWRRACVENADHPRAKELFNRHKLPGFHDPFAGGGTLPLEAQRLGLEAYTSDLNPVAVLITKAMIEIPPRFAGQPPVNPKACREKPLIAKQWKGAQGLAEDVRYYGRWLRDEAEKRIGHLYPKIEITAEMAKERPDLKPLVGQKLTVIAWLWARTVKSPNPAFAHVDVPLASTFMLSTKAGKEVYVEPVIKDGGYHFTVKVGKPKDSEAAKLGTTAGKRSAFRCLMSGVPVTYDHIRDEAKAGRMGARLMATVVQGQHRRGYLTPTADHETAAHNAKPEWKPEVEFFPQALGFRVGNYGMTKWSDLFTSRQLVALTTFSDLVRKARELVRRDAQAAGLPDGIALSEGGSGAIAYADAISVYLAFAVDKYAMYGNSLVPWYSKESRPSMLFSQQVLSMVWDYTEINPFSAIGGAFAKSVAIVADSLEGLPKDPPRAEVAQQNAGVGARARAHLVSTDPPYYDNVGYADLSDFFYVWLRRTLASVFPDLFATLTTPKAEELVATPGRHGGNEKAEVFFLDGMRQVMHRLTEQVHPAFPTTIYYAFRQSESRGDQRRTSTGWETFLEAVIGAGFSISGTWPMRTERAGRMRDSGSNALASSIVLV
ncbi:MAG TPA: hypothetical protein DEP84_22710, partial [Chloroflexi bacterium]|nr:hypothetical protein [Chloroflexota bacterium]